MHLPVLVAILVSGPGTSWDPAPTPDPYPGSYPATAPAPWADDFCRGAFQAARKLGWANLWDLFSACPALGRMVVFEYGYAGPTGTDAVRLNAFTWGNAHRQRLQALFEGMIFGLKDLGLDCPDPETQLVRSGQRRNADGTVSWSGPEVASDLLYTPSQAFDVFAAGVAHALALEVRGAVPWSLLDMPETELRELFDSTSYVSRIMPGYDYMLQAPFRSNFDFLSAVQPSTSYAFVCDPRVGYRFVRGETSASGLNLVGADVDSTLSSLTDFFRNNVDHGSYEAWRDASGQTYITLRDRLRRRTVGITAAEGCHGATGLFYDLAKSVNIPLLRVATRQDYGTSHGHHAGLVAHWGAGVMRYLHHTDDIYAMRYAPSFAIRADGTAMTAAEEKRAFFDNTWERVGAYTPWGFLYEGLEPITPGGPRSWIATYVKPSLGVVAGRWPADVGYPAGGLMQAYGRQLSYQLCSRYEVELVCDGGSLRDDLWTRFVLPVYRTLADRETRAMACASAWGGCAGVRTRIAAWQAAYGATYLP